MKIQHKKYQRCDTTQTGCPMLDSVHLYTLVVVREKYLSSSTGAGPTASLKTLGLALKNLLLFQYIWNLWPALSLAYMKLAAKNSVVLTVGVTPN